MADVAPAPRPRKPLTEEQRRRACERTKAWRLANPDRLKAHRAKAKAKPRTPEVMERARRHAAAWAAAHPEEKRARWKRTYEKNRAKYQALCRAHYYSDIERSRERMKRWKQEHPDAVASHCAARRALRVGSPGRHSTQEWLSTKASYHGLCVYCLGPAAQREHVVPLSLGGDDSIENIVPACKPCNASKKNTPLLVWLTKRAGRAA